MKNNFYTKISISLIVLLLAGCKDSSTQLSSSEEYDFSAIISSIIEESNKHNSSSSSNSEDVSITSSVISSISSISSSNSSSSTSISEPESTYTGTYYNAISSSISEAALKTALTSLTTSTHKTKTSYNDLKKVFWKTDGDPKNSKNIIMFYTGESKAYNETFGSSSGTINREHVWPNSRGSLGTSGPGSDAHHLRPCDYDTNSSRASYPYDYANGGNTVSSGAFEPANAYKGDAARIIFYVAVRYAESHGLVLKDSIKVSGAEMGKLSTLLEWNLKYPVGASEIRRNEAVYNIQGNRNPFIDHPEYACRIWGKQSVNTKSVCGY